MRFISMSGIAVACVSLLTGAGFAFAQDRAPIGFPTDTKDQAYTCSGQVMLAAFEDSEDSSAWPFTEAELMAAGRLWVEDYARRSGQSLDAVLSGDVARLSENLTTVPKGMRNSTVNWCVKIAPRVE
jgi:hypothetical protein